MLDRLSVRDVMTKEVKTIGRNDKLGHADELMKLERIRHLPVLTEDGQLAGIVSQRDLFFGALMRSMGYGSRAQANALDTYVAKQAMTEDVATVTPDAPLREAARMMRDRKIGCLVVLDSGRIVGILTEGDFVRLVAGASA